MVHEQKNVSSLSSSPSLYLSLDSVSPSTPPCLNQLKSEDRGLYLIQLLLSCATHVASGNIHDANACLEQISLLASPEGDSLQRMAAYFTEALARRVLKSWPGLSRALDSTKVCFFSESVLVQKFFLEICPFLKLAYMVSNQAITEAMQGEKMVHIIDLNALEPLQWVALIRFLSARPEGPPHLRITGVHEQRAVLDQTAVKLIEEAERLDVPFQFIPVVSKLESLDIEGLHVKTGEALAISSVFQLHSFLASERDGIRLVRTSRKSSSRGEPVENDSMSTPSTKLESLSLLPPKVDCFLSSLRGLSPKVMVVCEQESNHNGHSLMERVLESLYFYASLFDCLESTVPRSSVERVKVEKLLFGEEIKNIIACEGLERKERHEKFVKWDQRLNSLGFRLVPLSCFGLLQSARMLKSCGCDGYKIKQENGAILLCWQDRALFSVSAWSCTR